MLTMRSQPLSWWLQGYWQRNFHSMGRKVEDSYPRKIVSPKEEMQTNIYGTPNRKAGSPPLLWSVKINYYQQLHIFSTLTFTNKPTHYLHSKSDGSCPMTERQRDRNKQVGRFCINCWVLSSRWDQLFVTPWNVPCQVPLSFTVSLPLLKFMFIESLILSNCLIICCPLSLLPSIFPRSGSFPMSPLFASGGQSFRVSAPASVLPMKTQGWFLLGKTCLHQ